MQLIDTASQAANKGGGVGFGGNFNTANNKTIFSEIRGLKENSTSGNYAGALILNTRINGGNITERVRIKSTGQVKFNAYGSGSFTGTVTKFLGVTSAGDVIELAPPTGSGTVTGTGTSGRVSFWNGTSSITSDSNFTYDSTNDALTVGESSIAGGGAASVIEADTQSNAKVLTLQTSRSTGGVGLYFNQTSTRRALISYENSGNLNIASEYGNVKIFTGTNGTETEKMVIGSNGRVGIGVTSPTKKLDVNGVIKADYLELDSSSRSTSDISEPAGFIEVEITGSIYIIPYFTPE